MRIVGLIEKEAEKPIIKEEKNIEKNKKEEK